MREIYDELFAYQERLEQEIKTKISLNYKLARWIAFGFNEPNKMPLLSEEFPALFGLADEEELAESQGVEVWQIQKAQMADWVNAFNDTKKGSTQL